MNLDSKIRTYAIVAGAMLLTGAWAYVDYSENQIAQADGKIKILEEQAKAAKAESIRLDIALGASEFRFNAAERESARLAEVARKLRIPKPGPPAPVTADELTLAMRVALSPATLVVEDPSRDSVLNVADGQKVFNYFEEAKRIPGFELKVNAQDAAITSLETAVKDGKQSVGDCRKLVGSVGSELAISKQETVILTKQVQQAKSMGRVQKFLWGAAGVGVGFLAGKR